MPKTKAARRSLGRCTPTCGWSSATESTWKDTVSPHASAAASRSLKRRASHHGSGELRVENGVYEAYGQKLDVRTGRLAFAGGPIDQPGLNVEAVRRPAEGILVGARVRGTLKAPELTVFSEPTMPQQEQLSYLVLGRPLQSASDSESSAISRAALALGLRGGNFVSGRVNKNLGLDEFGIQTDLRVGCRSVVRHRQISVAEPLCELWNRAHRAGEYAEAEVHDLGGRRLVTESSLEASGGDIIYNIERK